MLLLLFLPTTLSLELSTYSSQFSLASEEFPGRLQALRKPVGDPFNGPGYVDRIEATAVDSGRHVLGWVSLLQKHSQQHLEQLTLSIVTILTFY